MLAHAVALRRRGISVVTVDTLPADLARPDIPTDRLAQLTASADDRPDADPARLAAAAARARARDPRARTAGVPIVPWAGPGTLDLVLRDLGRRSRAPRVVGR